MRYKNFVIITGILAIYSLLAADTATKIEKELSDISKEIAAIKGEVTSVPTPTVSPAPKSIVLPIKIAPPKTSKLTKQEITDELDVIKTKIEILSSNNINDVIDQIASTYKTIYKKDRSYRKAKEKRWEKIDFDLITSVPILLLSNKKQLAKIIELFLKKAHVLRRTNNKKELSWLKSVSRNLNNIEKHPQAYDHYYGPMHHKLFMIFTNANLLTKYLQQERINKEIQLIELNIKNLFLEYDKYNNFADLMNIIKRYIEWRNNQTINNPIPLYRWYGPKIPHTPYDKLVTKKLDKKNRKKRLEKLRDLLLSIQNYMKINKKDAFEKYHTERLPETLRVIEKELKE